MAEAGGSAALLDKMLEKDIGSVVLAGLVSGGGLDSLCQRTFPGCESCVMEYSAEPLNRCR